MQFLSIILLIPGMQFFSGYLTSAVSLLFPNWLSQYEKLMETAGLDSDIELKDAYSLLVIAAILVITMFYEYRIIQLLRNDHHDQGQP